MHKPQLMAVVPISRVSEIPSCGYRRLSETTLWFATTYPRLQTVAMRFGHPGWCWREQLTPVLRTA